MLSASYCALRPFSAFQGRTQPPPLRFPSKNIESVLFLQSCASAQACVTLARLLGCKKTPTRARNFKYFSVKLLCSSARSRAVGPCWSTRSSRIFFFLSRHTAPLLQDSKCPATFLGFIFSSAFPSNLQEAFGKKMGMSDRGHGNGLIKISVGLIPFWLSARSCHGLRRRAQPEGGGNICWKGNNSGGKHHAPSRRRGREPPGVNDGNSAFVFKAAFSTLSFYFG